MSKFRLLSGKALIRSGKLALSDDCCCHPIDTSGCCGDSFPVPVSVVVAISGMPSGRRMCLADAMSDASLIFNSSFEPPESTPECRGTFGSRFSGLCRSWNFNYQEDICPHDTSLYSCTGPDGFVRRAQLSIALVNDGLSNLCYWQFQIEWQEDILPGAGAGATYISSVLPIVAGVAQCLGSFTLNLDSWSASPGTYTFPSTVTLDAT